MKKLTILTLTILMIITMCSCGNMKAFGEFEFEHIYVETYKTEGQCFDMVGWVDTATGVEVEVEDGYTMFVAEGNYIMFTDAEKCHFCGGDK